MNEFEKALSSAFAELAEFQDSPVLVSKEHSFSDDFEKGIADICKQFSLPAKRFAQISKQAPKAVAWRKAAIAFCAVAACILLSLVAVPAIKNAISDDGAKISSPDDSYIAMRVEENALFCPSYTPNGFVLFSAEFEDDPTLGGVIEYSNAKGDVITFSYKKSCGELDVSDDCEIINVGSFKGYIDKTENSLTWEEYGYILKISGIDNADEMHKIACDIKHKDKIFIGLQTTPASSSNTDEPTQTTANRTETQAHSSVATTTPDVNAPEQIVHTGTFFTPDVTSAHVTSTTTDTVVTYTCTTYSAHTSAFAPSVVTTEAVTSTCTAYSKQTSTFASSVVTTADAVTSLIEISSAYTTADVASTTTIYTNTTAITTTSTTVATTTVTTVTTTTTTTTTTTWPERVAAEVKYWRPHYGDSRVSDSYETTEYPCMTIVHSMEQLEALNGTIYEIDFDLINTYLSDLTEDYLTEEFFAEHDFVIFLNHDSSGSFNIGIQSAKVTEDHIFEVTVSHYYPGTAIDWSMEMYALGIAVPKGALDQVGGYAVNWEYFGHASNVPEGNESSTAYDNSIPEVLYIEYEFAY